MSENIDLYLDQLIDYLELAHENIDLYLDQLIDYLELAHKKASQFRQVYQREIDDIAGKVAEVTLLVKQMKGFQDLMEKVEKAK